MFLCKLMKKYACGLLVWGMVSISAFASSQEGDGSTDSSESKESPEVVIYENQPPYYPEPYVYPYVFPDVYVGPGWYGGYWYDNKWEYNHHHGQYSHNGEYRAWNNNVHGDGAWKGNPHGQEMHHHEAHPEASSHRENFHEGGHFGGGGRR